jgi:hypothetical protein
LSLGVASFSVMHGIHVGAAWKDDAIEAFE